MKPEDLKRAEAVALGLSAEWTPEKEAEIRDRIAREFFGEEGLPPHLKEGWAVLEQSRAARAEVGYPLPPGGCLALGRSSVVAGALAEMHTGLARLLNLSVDCIRLRLDRSDGNYKPVADVEVPPDWVIPVAANVTDPKQATIDHINRAVEIMTLHWRKIVLERLGAVDRHRADVAQKIVG
jgi:hypothetical protein